MRSALHVPPLPPGARQLVALCLGAHRLPALCLCVFVLASIGAPAGAQAQAGDEVVAATAIYIRNDTNATTVVSPRLRVAAPLGEGTSADLTYTVDVWTSASVDIVSAATPVVTEQRDEIDATVSHVLSDVTLSVSYRYSRENDYTSNGGTLGASLELAQKNTTLAGSLTYLSDEVGRSGDPSFQKRTRTVSIRGSATQILTRDAVGQLIYEYGNNDGYLSSPYRYVGFGTMGEAFSGTCKLPSRSCQLEVNPDARTRHALALRGRHALGESMSVGGGYRFYMDDWSLNSHTLDADIAWVLSPQWVLGGELRYYTQGAADHYQAFYLQDQNLSYFTSDKELSPLSSTRGGLRVVRTLDLDDAGSRMRTVLSGAYTYFGYDDFLRVSAIHAVEATLALEFLL